jgi:hypothetical protein
MTMTTKPPVGSHAFGRQGLVSALLPILTLTLMLALAGSAGAASIAVTPGSFATTLSTHQAGAHPDMTTAFNLDHDSVYSPIGGTPRDIAVELPKGLVGAANATPTCSMRYVSDFSKPCPLTTAVGEIDAQLYYLGLPFPIAQHELVFNVTPSPGEPAALGFTAIFPVRLDTKLRSDGDYGITATATNLTEAASLIATKLTLWGVPADHTGPGTSVDQNTQRPYGGPGEGVRHPFLTNPTACSTTGSLVSALAIDAWQAPGVFANASYDIGSFTGCDRLAFAPAIDIRPDNRTAGAPAGLAVDLSVAQNPDPDGLATAHVKDVSVTLPAGMTLSPSAADGLGGCSDAQIGLKVLGAATCPDSSKIGTVKVTTPLLDDPLEGEVFLGTQNSNDPTSGQMYRMFLQVQGSGVRVKLPGSVTADPDTGQLTTTFAENPQLPFDTLELRFKGGPRAPLSNPETCGVKTTQASLTSWADPTTPVHSDSSFVIDQGCDQANRFDPSLDAGLIDPAAGGSSPFTLTLSRPDGQQDFSGVDVTLPAGLLGKVGSIAQCPEPQALAGTCPAASQVGRTTIGAGAGTSPLSVPQAGKAPTAVYLAGPYKGAPFSLSIVVPAQAGPFDLGTVIVRAALLVDPIDGHVTVKSDPLPTILDGVPLNVQTINVTVDRPGFMVAPTNCTPKTLTADVRSTAGASVALTNGFQAAGCAGLGLKPKLALALSGKGQTTDGKHPAIDATLTQPTGQANLKKVRVALPLSLALDPDNAQALCEFTDGSKVDPSCPKGSIVGTATAITPILDGPVSGPVYFVKNIRTDPKSGREIRTLPKLVIPLIGQNGVKLTLTGTSAVEGDQLVTTFDTIPDAPVSSFKLSIIGGKGGILVISGDKADVCRANQIAKQEIQGQNGKVANAGITIQTPACATKVISKKVSKSSIVLKVGGLGAGKLTVSGAGVKKTTKTITNATVTTITAKRTKGTPGKVTVSFDPTGPAKARKTTTTLR